MTSNGYDIYRPNTKRLVFMVINRTFPEDISDRTAYIDRKYNVFSEYFGFETCTPLSYTRIKEKLISTNNEEERQKLEEMLKKEEEHFVHNASEYTLKEEIEEVRKRLDDEHENISCLVVILSTHGEVKQVTEKRQEHFVICSDGKRFRTLEIIENLTTKKHIPTVFIIQACRHLDVKKNSEESKDKGVNILVVNKENKSTSADTRESGQLEACRHLDVKKQSDESEDKGAEILVEDTENQRAGISPSHNESLVQGTSADTRESGQLERVISDEQPIIVPACAPHTCVLFSSPEGKKSYIRDHEGSWLLSALHEVVSEMQETEISIFDLFTRVNNRMSKKKTKDQLKCASCFRHQMTKEIVLKVQDASI